MDELVPNSESIVLLSERGFIKRMPIDTFGAQSRNTRGKQSGKLRENDKVLKMMQCKDHDKVGLSVNIQWTTREHSVNIL